MKTAHRKVIDLSITTSDFYFKERIETKSILPKASRKTKTSRGRDSGHAGDASYAREGGARDYEAVSA